MPTEKLEFGKHPRQKESERFLEFFTELKQELGRQPSKTELIDFLDKKHFWSADQWAEAIRSWKIQKLDRLLKTPDSTGLPVYGQLPLVNPRGENLIEERRWMDIDGYAFNFLLRERQVEAITLAAETLGLTNEKWKAEAIDKFGKKAFTDALKRLKEAEGAAA